MPSIFDLSSSLRRAEARLGPASGRRTRSDIGSFRIDPQVRAELRRLLAGDEYPGARAILEQLGSFCARKKLRCPSRATLYKLMEREPGRSYEMAALPSEVRSALYNLGAEVGRVPGPQVAFYCFNYGELGAIHFAARLPWVALHQASKMRGWRARSRGLLCAVLLARRIPGG